MTKVANWDDPPAKFELDGPFTVGSRERTRLPSQAPLQWRLQEIHPLKSYAIEMALDGATRSFEWRFDRLAGGGTRLTQQIGGERRCIFRGCEVGIHREPCRRHKQDCSRNGSGGGECPCPRRSPVERLLRGKYIRAIMALMALKPEVENPWIYSYRKRSVWQILSRFFHSQDSPLLGSSC